MQGRCRHGRRRRNFRFHRHQQFRFSAPQTSNHLRLQGGLRWRPLRDRPQRVCPRTLPDFHELHAGLFHRGVQLSLSRRSNRTPLQRQRDHLYQPKMRGNQSDVVFRQELRAVHHQTVVGATLERKHGCKDTSSNRYHHVRGR